MKSDVGDRIVEKSMKENRNKVTLVLKGIIQNILKIISTVWLIRGYLEELNKNLLAGVLVLLPDYPNNNWLTA